MTEQPTALRLAHALDAEIERTVALDMLHHNAAAELRRLHAENEALRKANALLQQHHATAWHRGHTTGMQAAEAVAKQALDAVKRDAWGNTQLTEALMAAEAMVERDTALLRQALDCLERSETNAHYEGFGRAAERKHEDTIAALRERLGDKA